ncbi:AraC family transcriptional regulator [Bradyrhizobium sp. CCGUVB23]|uniref:AraC family transcriptional regulator n=1 Tax=Bradyrhizobium sp. CCGUVB23 TaxID=2949630 RepID=UPI0020B2B4CF|nr:AraC family transcriptional regulator [Bradyrhizobium sp. CCGUVB23]MCP3463694.1 AraC family transcriptional regulator [Bradyrhizobium sp. CCGUVB23]
MQNCDTNDLSIMDFSTDAFPERDRQEAFCESVARSLLKLDVSPLHDLPLAATMSFRALPGLGLSTGRLSPIHCRHLSAQTDNDDFVLVVSWTGGCSVLQGNQETELHNGQATLTANGVRGEVWSASSTASDYLNLRLSRSLLEPRLSDFSTALARPIGADTPALRLLLGYCRILNDEKARFTAELGSAVATHIHDLVALAVGASRDGTEIARRGVAAARLHAVKADIRAHLADPKLSVAVVAARHRVTPRYIHRLFELDGTTFSEFALTLRLTHADGMLRDARFLDRTISTIAFDCGFSDLSYFNRTFKRFYSATPSDIRRTVRWTE